MKIFKPFLSLALLAFAILLRAEPADDPLAPWRAGVQVRLVSPDAPGHTIHSYFNTCPESPDGKYVLFFASTTRDGQHGDVRIRDRATGEEKVLAKNLYVEDAHRVACQQWLSRGKRVVFHGERDGEWIVTAVDVETGVARDLARGRLSGWGQPNADLVPLYGPHWNPGEHRDLELLDVGTGEIRTVLKASDIKIEWVTKLFGDKPTSIFFPILSPDLTRVFFKMATATGPDPRSKAASDRQGLVCYSLAGQRFLHTSTKWGHPAWHPDSRRILEVGYQLIDSESGKTERIAGLPPMGSGHPSMSPDGKLIVTDLTMDHLGSDAKEWGIVVADVRGGSHVLIHQFDNSHGASSWRVSHPHPIFSPDGHRIYFNVSSGPWTQLHVAEVGNVSAGAK